MITDTQLDEFRLKLDKVNREYYESEMTIPDYFGGIEMKKGSKNAKYLITTGGSRSVLLFVDLQTGDILKAATFTAPAKGSRGNIATTVPEHRTHWLYR